MRIPLSWLREFVEITLPPEELAHRLTMAGLEAGAVERVGASWEHCSVGRVLAVEPHPNADRLTLCTVEVEGEQLRVVCGAPNVAQGQKIAFAPVGARLYDAHSGKLETLKAARIRGVVSEGMICSERELGLGEDHTGILVLPEDAPVGTALEAYLGDTILDLEVTANRADGLSMLGIAYEIGAIAGAPVREPNLAYPEQGPPIEEQVTIEVWDDDLCPRYTASLVTEVSIGPSPQWMQDRLIKAGMRPINNVVDITNYVMLEYGQPLHAFDYQALKKQTVIVRQARLGEVLESLDGVRRKLEPPMLVIADAEDAVGLAGVMGGANSEVSERTTSVLLESASFHPFNTRRTAGALKLRTEASLRFEKGLRPGLPPMALRRATQLIVQLAGGVAAKGIIDVYPGRREAPSLTLTMARLRQVLGVEIPLPEVQRALSALGFGAQGAGIDALRVEVPYWRADIAIEDDLVEEVARVIGYDQIPTTMLATPIPHHNPDPRRELKERVRDLLAAGGFQEVIAYSLVSREALEKAEVPSEGTAAPMRVSNPLTPEHEYLRPNLRPSLLATLAANQRLEEGPLQLFELSRVYLPRPGDLPAEREVAAGVLVGPRATASWLEDPDPLGFYEAKGALEAVLDRLGVQPTYEATNDPLFHPGKGARIMVREESIGCIGEVHPDILERFDIEGGLAAYFEIDLSRLLEALPQEIQRFQPPPRFPDASRDLALLVDLEVPAARVQEIIKGHPLVTRVTLFDVYSGPQVDATKRSLAYRVVFQSPERTLTSEEVGQALEQILATLEREVGASQRQG